MDLLVRRVGHSALTPGGIPQSEGMYVFCVYIFLAFV